MRRQGGRRLPNWRWQEPGSSLLGGLSVLLGVYPVVGIILLIVFLLGVSFQMHSYWKVDDAQMKQIDMINFTKNIALVGALLMFLLLPRPWPMSLGIG